MPNATATDATLVASTGRRTVVRRSTVGDGTRSSHHPNTAKTTSDEPNMPSVRPLVHPQVCPFEMPSSSVTNPAANSRAPIGSRRWSEREGTCGTSVVNMTSAMTPSAVANQNSMCQS